MNTPSPATRGPHASITITASARSDRSALVLSGVRWRTLGHRRHKADSRAFRGRLQLSVQCRSGRGSGLRQIRSRKARRRNAPGSMLPGVSVCRIRQIEARNSGQAPLPDTPRGLPFAQWPYRPTPCCRPPPMSRPRRGALPASRLRTPLITVAGARRADRRARVPQGRDAAAHRLVQVPRRLQQALVDPARASAPAAWWPFRPAITRKAWRRRRAARHAGGHRDAVATRRGRSASAPRRSAPRSCSTTATREDRAAIARDIARRARRDAGAALRRSAGHRRAGHRRPRDRRGSGGARAHARHRRGRRLGRRAGGRHRARRQGARAAGAASTPSSRKASTITLRSFKSGKRESNAAHQRHDLRRADGADAGRAHLRDQPHADRRRASTASDDEVGRAVAFAFHELKLVVEPGGAVGARGAARRQARRARARSWSRCCPAAMSIRNCFTAWWRDPRIAPGRARSREQRDSLFVRQRHERGKRIVLGRLRLDRHDVAGPLAQHASHRPASPEFAAPDGPARRRVAEPADRPDCATPRRRVSPQRQRRSVRRSPNQHGGRAIARRWRESARRAPKLHSAAALRHRASDHGRRRDRPARAPRPADRPRPSPFPEALPGRSGTVRRRTRKSRCQIPRSATSRRAPVRCRHAGGRGRFKPHDATRVNPRFVTGTFQTEVSTHPRPACHAILQFPQAGPSRGDWRCSTPRCSWRWASSCPSSRSGSQRAASMPERSDSCLRCR